MLGNKSDCWKRDAQKTKGITRYHKFEKYTINYYFDSFIYQIDNFVSSWRIKCKSKRSNITKGKWSLTKRIKQSIKSLGIDRVIYKISFNRIQIIQSYYKFWY